jgi:hypothetical protein
MSTPTTTTTTPLTHLSTAHILSGWRRGVAVAVIHVALVSSLGAKLMYDRATRPRVWARTMQYDPDLPIRGRYLSIQVVVNSPEALARRGKQTDGKPAPYYGRGELYVRNGQLYARPADDGSVAIQTSWRTPDELVVQDPVPFFIPEHANVRMERGDEMWVEVTVPKKGVPRPIRLALKHAGEFKVLPLS